MDERLTCEVCKCAAPDLGMIPHVERVICRNCASDAQNELIVRANNKMGSADWHGPKHELGLIVAGMLERKVA